MTSYQGIAVAVATLFTSFAGHALAPVTPVAEPPAVSHPGSGAVA